MLRVKLAFPGNFEITGEFPDLDVDHTPNPFGLDPMPEAGKGCHIMRLT